MVKRFAKYFVSALCRRYLLPLMVVSTLSVWGAAKNSQELFLRANREYKNEQYIKAHDLYESVERKGRAVWYNLGNCCYQLKQYPQAIAWWRRAEQGASFAEQQDIEYNVDRARQTQGYHENPQPLWQRWLRASAAPFPLIILQLLFILAWYSLFWLLIVQRGAKGIKGMLLVAGLVCVLVWLSAVLFEHYQKTYYPRAVVQRSTTVYAGPHDHYHVVGDLAATDELKIIEQRTGWCKVVRDQTYGWVPVYNLTII